MSTNKSDHRSSCRGFGARQLRHGLTAAALLGTVWASPADASPVLFAGTGNEKVNSSQIVVMQKDGMSAVTVTSDYRGNLQPFAVILAVPDDVTTEDVTTLKQEFIGRIEHVTAPRFAEFWEMDPCDTAKVQQTWERNMKANDSSGFLGVMKTDPSKKVAKELLMDVEAKKKEGEYTEINVGDADELKSWLGEKGLSLPSGGDGAISEYAGAGYKFLYLMVDQNMVELTGGSTAKLSPIRFFTQTEFSTIPARFGLPSAAETQEMLIYTLVPDQRMQVGNYTTKPAPTNVTVDFAVKERMGELYNAMWDKFQAQNPNTFWLEYAFSTADCGKPCPMEPMLPHEMMSLGGDAFDALLPDDVVHPEPPEPTDEEAAKLEGLLDGRTAKEKKVLEDDWEKERAELVYRKALIARHTYVLSRLHYRYNASQLPKDPELTAGAAITGGVALPMGSKGEADSAVRPSEKNEFHTRFNNLHENIKVINCETPERYRWGKPPRTYRGSKKIWVADDFARKSRTQINADETVLTAVPDLGLAGKVEAPPPPPPVEEKSCGCRAAGVPTGGNWAALGAALVGLAFWRRRRQA